ncbi:MAG: D-alanyl-D-alanine carboxypeptidase [Candidatus Levybacteria bacterium]|nr:D-alanyl-D-alanine carboxypeptidase [Candidatus Levybacteria bacterium]
MKKKIIKKKSPRKKLSLYIHKYEKGLHLLLSPLILLVLVCILHFIVLNIKSQAVRQQVARDSVRLEPLPYLFFAKPISPILTAEAAIIIDRDAKTVLYEKNSHLRFSMASTTKIVTALVALDHFKPHDVLIAKRSRVEGVNVGVEIGDTLYFRDALYAMLLPSGNDIAMMIADNYPGGQKVFVEKMNKKMKELHLLNTHFADPAGLDDDGNYTTALELAQLAAHASKNVTVAEIVATKTKIISTADGSKIFSLTNLNKLLGYEGVVGLKTGHTEGAGDVLLTSVVSNGHTFIVVVMRSQDRFFDTEILLSYITSGIASFKPKFNDY